MKVTISWKAPDKNNKTRTHRKVYHPRGIDNENDAVEWAMAQIERLKVKNPDIEIEDE